MTTIELAGELLQLRPDRTLFWAAKRTLFLADPHFGKAAAFRAALMPIPGDCASSLSTIELALNETSAERLVILGDFWHAREGITESVHDELTTWRQRHHQLAITLLRGNHDTAPPPPAWAAHWHAGSSTDPPFVYCHHPCDHTDGYTLAGHVHPGVRLHGRGRQRVRLPCFVVGERGAILPAFGEFTGLADVEPACGVRLYAVAGNHVLAVPPRVG